NHARHKTFNQARREATVMLIYEAPNVAQTANVPEFFIDAVGHIEVNGNNVVMSLCRETLIGKTQFLVPKCEIIRPLALTSFMIEHWQLLQRITEGDATHEAALFKFARH